MMCSFSNNKKQQEQKNHSDSIHNYSFASHVFSHDFIAAIFNFLNQVYKLVVSINSQEIRYPSSSTPITNLLGVRESEATRKKRKIMESDEHLLHGTFKNFHPSLSSVGRGGEEQKTAPSTMYENTLSRRASSVLSPPPLSVVGLCLQRIITSVSFHDIGKDLFNLADTLFNMYRELQVLF
jgi:hypothetical protein